MGDTARKRWRPPKVALKGVFLGLGAVALIIAGAGGYWYATRDTGPLPSQVRAELTFSPLVLPPGTKDYTAADYKFSTAEGKVQILSFLIRTKNGTTISLSEYTQPPEFTEIPEYKDRFLTNVAKQYATVQTSNGTIYLGRMPRQNNKQLAVLLERGLLVFMSPDKELSHAQWRNLGDQLEIQRVTN